MSPASTVSKDTRVWVHTAVGAGGPTWRSGTVVALSGSSCKVALDSDGNKDTVHDVSVPISQLEHANPSLLDAVRCESLPSRPACVANLWPLGSACCAVAMLLAICQCQSVGCF